ncbi:MAG TPA: LysR substrate-binding domain-containing protein [Ramlibacter sp.]|nr:LysR substrate-binding domain-containing protein [Ramlibacter sp.]
MNGRPPRRGTGDFLRLRHLRLLELVQRGGSLAAAARELHLSQPAVTKMLHELEAAFGTALVARGARGGSLTAQGQVALQRLRLGLAQFDSALAAAHSDRPDMPTLRLGVVPLVSVSLLPRALRDLARRSSPIRLFLRESTAQGLLQLLAAGEVDGVIGRADPDALTAVKGARLVQVPLVSEQLVFACSPTHRLAKARRVDLATLQAQDWVMAAAGSQTRRQFDSLFLAEGLQPPTPIIESMSFHANLQLVHALGALTLAPAGAVKLYQRMGIAQPVRSAIQLPAGALSLMYLADHEELPALRALGESLQTVSSSE